MSSFWIVKAAEDDQPELFDYFQEALTRFLVLIGEGAECAELKWSL